MPAKEVESGGETKTHIRYAPEVVALRKARALRRKNQMLFPPARIQSKMRGVVKAYKSRYGLEKVHLSAAAVYRMTQLAESYMTRMIQNSLLFTTASKRSRLMGGDFLGACKISDGAHGKILHGVFGKTYYDQSDDLQKRLEKVQEQHAKAAARKREAKKQQKKS